MPIMQRNVTKLENNLISLFSKIWVLRIEFACVEIVITEFLGCDLLVESLLGLQSAGSGKYVHARVDECH